MKSPSALTKTLGFEIYSSVFGAHGKQQQSKPRILWGGQGTHILGCSVQSGARSSSIYTCAVVCSIWSGDMTLHEPAGLTYPLIFFLTLVRT